MNCAEFRDGIFDPPTEKGMAHEVICSECANLRDRIQAEEILIRKAYDPAPPADLWKQVQARIHAGRSVPRSRIISWMGAAAALLLAVIGVIVARDPDVPRREPNLQLNVVEVSPEATRSLSGFVPGYDQGDSRQALANAVVPFDFRGKR